VTKEWFSLFPFSFSVGIIIIDEFFLMMSRTVLTDDVLSFRSGRFQAEVMTSVQFQTLISKVSENKNRYLLKNKNKNNWL
jgi:hypothetical protein